MGIVWYDASKRYHQMEMYRRRFRRIRDLWEEYDAAQHFAADDGNIHPTVSPRYEAGTREIPAQGLIGLAKLYHVSADDPLDLKRKRKS